MVAEVDEIVTFFTPEELEGVRLFEKYADMDLWRKEVYLHVVRFSKHTEFAYNDFWDSYKTDTPN